MLRKLLIASVLFGAFVGGASKAWAATYDSGKYGECRYSEGCEAPVVIPPPATPPPVAPGSVSRDIDGDGNLETATDTNAQAADGYEEFGDADSSSTVLKSLDGDNDGKVDFIINTDNDEFPERYWDPDSDLLSTVQLVECDNDTTPEWRFETGVETKTYDPDTGKFLESCETPSPPVVSGSGKSKPAVEETRLTNSLPFLADNPVYKSIGEAVKKVPAPVAYSFPYVLLLLILILVFRLVAQSRHEVNRLLVATKAQETENLLSLEKANFMMLSSHYLRTPITIIQGNIELMQSLKQITEEVGKVLNSAGRLLLDQVSSLLARLEEDKKLAVIQASGHPAKIKTFISPVLVLPVILIVALILLGQFLFVDFRVVSPNIVNTLIQLVLVALLVQTFLSKLRQRQLNRHNREDQERILNEQRALDAARSEFINGVANNLEAQLLQFKKQLGPVIEQKEALKVKNALNQLASMVSKFRLVAFLQGQQLQAGKVNFGLRDVVGESLQPYLQAAQARNISITDNIQDGQLYQQRQLIGIILKSLLDNALKYSTDGSRVEVAATTSDGQAVFSVTDHGQGIPKDKQELLFKPFSRTDSAETFDTEGLGFSLYLDKVIANYLQGNIAVESDQGMGAKVTVTVPSTL
jgi:signal transduction histidine kinase